MKTQEEKNDLETGTVLKTEGQWASVITNKSKSCNECGKAQAGICGKSGAGMVIKVKNDAGAKVWDTVLLELDGKTHVKAYFLVFILPVLTLFISAYAGHLISQSSGIQGLDAAAGFFGLTHSFYGLVPA
ncbi:MAG: SoxR reducing system RseC family protein [Nitrospirae bacterium]|nr:SoxR reducing system RseC family protein [Nitrospirota bacterium]